jgi:hypothetical protein
VPRRAFVHTVVSLQFVSSVKAEEFLTKTAFFLHYRTDEVKSCTYQRHVFCFDTDCIFAGTGIVCNSRLLFSHSNKQFAEEAEKFA